MKIRYEIWRYGCRQTDDGPKEHRSGYMAGNGISYTYVNFGTYSIHYLAEPDEQLRNLERHKKKAITGIINLK